MARRLGEMLVAEGLVTDAQLQAAVQEQADTQDFLGAILVRQGILDEEALVEVLARQPGVSRVHLDQVQLDPELAGLVPEDLARKRGCIPVQRTGNMLQLGLADPTDEKTIDFMHQHTGCTIKAAAVAPSQLEAAWQQLYSRPAHQGRSGSAAPGETTPLPEAAEVDEMVEKGIQEVADAELGLESSSGAEAMPLEIAPTDPPVVRLSNLILLKCVQSGASDIHVEPQEETVRVRYRIDGTLHQLFTLPGSLRGPLISRFKIMSEMDVAEHRVPQDGRIKLQLSPTEDIDFRVNTLPGVLGEKLVARILGTGMLKDRVAELGFTPENLEHAENALKSHFGMVLVTGPTGSGKTTTLYTMLSQVNTEEVNIVTAEDPVEYNLPGIHQVNVRAAIGFTFDTALRSFLRQDPDIILVGEMRDYETAAIAIKAALTGHLVLSTLHTNDAPSTVVRLIDMGIEPYLVASAVKLVIAQRLLRKLCPECREELPVSTLDQLDIPLDVVEDIERVFGSKGCGVCNNLGHKGRLPLFEVMPVKSREMRRIITEGGTEVQVGQVARKEGLVTLSQNAIRYVNEGTIGVDEGIKIVLSD